MSENPIKRLNWGCGRLVKAGWINSDRVARHNIDLACDIREGLPLETDSIDYAVSIHALQEIPLDGQIPVLQELKRVLKPGGVLRLCLPDLDKGIAAYLRRDKQHFLIPDSDAASLGGKFITHMLWYGHSRLLFTADFIEELLKKSGFNAVSHCSPHETASAHPAILELDTREAESLFVEAVK